MNYDNFDLNLRLGAMTPEEVTSYIYVSNFFDKQIDKENRQTYSRANVSYNFNKYLIAIQDDNLLFEKIKQPRVFEIGLLDYHFSWEDGIKITVCKKDKELFTIKSFNSPNIGVLDTDYFIGPNKVKAIGIETVNDLIQKTHLKEAIETDFYNLLNLQPSDDTIAAWNNTKELRALEMGGNTKVVAKNFTEPVNLKDKIKNIREVNMRDDFLYNTSIADTVVEKSDGSISFRLGKPSIPKK